MMHCTVLILTVVILFTAFIEIKPLDLLTNADLSSYYDKKAFLVKAFGISKCFFGKKGLNI
jgi:hypothetical protein